MIISSQIFFLNLTYYMFLFIQCVKSSHRNMPNNFIYNYWEPFSYFSLKTLRFLLTDLSGIINIQVWSFFFPFVLMNLNSFPSVYRWGFDDRSCLHSKIEEPMKRGNEAATFLNAVSVRKDSFPQMCLVPLFIMPVMMEEVLSSFYFLWHVLWSHL